MATDAVALADAHPATTSTASRTAPAVLDTRVSARTVTGYLAPFALSAPVQGRAEEAERRGAEVEHGRMEALEGEGRPPVLPGPLAQPEDLQLAPGVPAVARVEGAPPGLGQRRGPGQVRVGLEPARRVLDRHPGRVQADGARQPGHPDQRLQPDADGNPRVAVAEPLFHAQFLAVVGPALDERAGLQGLPDVRRQVAQGSAVREVPGCHLVHR